MPDDDLLDERLVIRMSSADMKQLRKVSGPVPRALVAREALKIGLAYFAKNPGEVLRLPPAPRGPRPKKRRRSDED